MTRTMMLMLCAATAVAMIAAGCGGSSNDDKTPSSDPTAAGTSSGSRTPAAGATKGSSTATSGAADGRTWTMDDAQALLATLPLTPDDLPAKWMKNSDTTQDNAAAMAADPIAGASFERCGRLLSRLVVNGPAQDELVSRYVGGETVSIFSTFTVYATDEGAADCAIEAAQRFSQCPELAKAFGSVFIDPAAVSCVPFDYPQVGDGSFAIGLTGKISAAGTIVDLTIRIVAFRQGNVTGVVGSAAAFDPNIEELKPLVDKVLERISSAQS